MIENHRFQENTLINILGLVLEILRKILPTLWICTFKKSIHIFTLFTEKKIAEICLFTLRLE